MYTYVCSFIHAHSEEEDKSYDDMTLAERKIDDANLELELRILIDNMKANIPLLEKVYIRTHVHSRAHTHAYIHTQEICMYFLAHSNNAYIPYLTEGASDGKTFQRAGKVWSNGAAEGLLWYTFTHIYVCLYVCICLVCVCIHLLIHLYIHSYIHTHPHSAPI